MKNKYTILAGSKNNAGDFLIKFRAKKLFKELSLDREIIDFKTKYLLPHLHAKMDFSEQILRAATIEIYFKNLCDKL